MVTGFNHNGSDIPMDSFDQIFVFAQSLRAGRRICGSKRRASLKTSRFMEVYADASRRHRRLRIK
jgi:hypothetical protein